MALWMQVPFYKFIVEAPLEHGGLGATRLKFDCCARFTSKFPMLRDDDAQSDPEAIIPCSLLT